MLRQNSMIDIAVDHIISLVRLIVPAINIVSAHRPMIGLFPESVPFPVDLRILIPYLPHRHANRILG